MPRPLVIAYLIFSAAFIAMAARYYDATAVAIAIASLVMFAACFVSATTLLGIGPAKKFAVLAVAIGWFAEQMGSSHGWFFGSYTYTDVLGPALGNVPMVIPLMWFALCFIGYALANLILWKQPTDASANLSRIAGATLIAAMIVTAFDLGADPYFVFVMKAWIMTKKDGGWFGETLQGFVGWVFIAFVIIFLFRLWTRPSVESPATPAAMRAALVPLAIYASGMVFQIFLGHPIETRAIAVFAMGIPLLCAFHGWQQWRVVPAQGASA
ncbi:MAG: carotenoid biosynthesis protein [Burkholderiaceae bacterium]